MNNITDRANDTIEIVKIPNIMESKLLHNLHNPPSRNLREKEPKSSKTPKTITRQFYKLIQKNDLENLKKLLAKESINHEEDKYCLMTVFAVEYANLELLKELINAVAKTNENVMAEAVLKGDREIILYLMSIGCPLTTRSVIASENRLSGKLSREELIDGYK